MPDSRTHTPTPSLRQRLVEAADFYAARPSVNQAISVPRMREISTRECSELARLLHSAIASYDGLVEALRCAQAQFDRLADMLAESSLGTRKAEAMVKARHSALMARRALEAAGITEATNGK